MGKESLKIGKIINDLKRVKQAHLANAKNDVASAYRRGCYNGLEFAISVLEGRDAAFIGVKEVTAIEYVGNWIEK